jgi:hypothetical protein
MSSDNCCTWDIVRCRFGKEDWKIGQFPNVGLSENRLLECVCVCVCVCKRIFFGDDVGRYRNIIWSITAIQILLTSHSILKFSGIIIWWQLHFVPFHVVPGHFVLVISSPHTFRPRSFCPRSFHPRSFRPWSFCPLELNLQNFMPREKDLFKM